MIKEIYTRAVILPSNFTLGWTVFRVKCMDNFVWKIRSFGTEYHTPFVCGIDKHPFNSIPYDKTLCKLLEWCAKQNITQEAL